MIGVKVRTEKARMEKAQVEKTKVKDLGTRMEKVGIRTIGIKVIGISHGITREKEKTKEASLSTEVRKSQQLRMPKLRVPVHTKLRLSVHLLHKVVVRLKPFTS